jgi:hypothetical protein
MKMAEGTPLAPLGAMALLIAPLLLAGVEFITAGAIKMYVLELSFVCVTTGLALAHVIKGNH